MAVVGFRVGFIVGKAVVGFVVGSVDGEYVGLVEAVSVRTLLLHPSVK